MGAWRSLDLGTPSALAQEQRGANTAIATNMEQIICAGYQPAEFPILFAQNPSKPSPLLPPGSSPHTLTLVQVQPMQAQLSPSPSGFFQS